MAYMDRAEELMTSSRCSLTDSLSVNVTPSIFSEWTRSMPCITGGGATRCRFRLSWKTISTDIDAFNVRLLTFAQASSWQFLCHDCLHYRPVSPNTYHPRISLGYYPDALASLYVVASRSREHPLQSRCTHLPGSKMAVLQFIWSSYFTRVADVPSRLRLHYPHQTNWLLQLTTSLLSAGGPFLQSPPPISGQSPCTSHISTVSDSVLRIFSSGAPILT